MNNVTFLRPRAPEMAQPEAPLSERDVYRLWHRAGIIQRVSVHRWQLADWIVGLLLMGWAVGFACGYFVGFAQ